MNKPKLLSLVRQEIRRRNYSYRTEEAYCRWIRQYVRFHNLTHPALLHTVHVESFLNYLVADRNVAASTQNQALCAIVFLGFTIENSGSGFQLQTNRSQKWKRIAGPNYNVA